MTTVRHPPGRSGRLWLHRRLATAERGSEQLGHKLRVMLKEHARLERERAVAEQAWAAAIADARRWQLRAGVLGGQRAYADGVPPAPARFELPWTSVVDVTIPGAAHRIGPPATAPEAVGNSAVVAAVAAFDAALGAAVDLAVAQEAAHRLEVEIALTRRRVRAIERRWLPALRAALAGVEQALELDEQEEGDRLRRALPHGDRA